MRRRDIIIILLILSGFLGMPEKIYAQIRPVYFSDLEALGDNFRSIFFPSPPNLQTILATSTRSGATVVNAPVPHKQTSLTLSIFADPTLIKDSTALSVTIEQVASNGESWVFGGMEVSDVKRALVDQGKLTLSLGEQVMREDIIEEGWRKYRRIYTENDTYYQMAIENVRITIRAFDPETGEDLPLRYSASIVTDDARPPGLPSGHRSASLLGTFAAAETTAATNVTSGSRTSVSESLIVGFGASWEELGGQNNTISDSKSNSFTEQLDFTFGSGNPARLTISYNIGGTRGASHTITNTKTGAATFVTVGGGEFSGVASSPTVVSNSATGNGTTPSVSVTAGASSLFVGIAGYDGGTNTTITENTGGGWALIVEADENNDAQVFNSQYKAAITGAQTASWTLGTTKDWGAGVVALTEVPSNSPYPFRVRSNVKIRGGIRLRR